MHETSFNDGAPLAASDLENSTLYLSDPQFRMASWLEQAWMSRYLARQLDDAECAWFETYMLHWPHLVAEVEADEALREALSALPVAPSTVPAKLSKPRRRRTWFPIALAAASFALAWVISPLLHTPSLPPMDNPPRYVYDTMRGAPESPHVETGSTTATYVIVEIAMPIEATSLTIHSTDNRPLLSITEPGPEGYATALISRADFAGARATLHFSDGRTREIALSSDATHGTGSPSS